MTARATIPPGRNIHVRVVFERLPEGGYRASVPIWGFAYEMEIRGAGGQPELTVFDGAEPVGAYRQPALDGEAA